MDVYKGRFQAEKNIIIYSLFISFFPQLLAGPIERAKNLIPQLYLLNNFDSERFLLSLKRILWGFVKKIVVADNLAVIVDRVYGNYSEHTGIELLIATYFFSIQIYCDFSGYVDIAIGVSQIFGIKLSENFNFPYASKSIKEFWHRWHITLSTWFRDYIYIPLGGNQTGNIRWYFNIFIVFLLSGLWHGANWTFLVWGLIHGFYLIIENSVRLFLNLNLLKRIKLRDNIFLKALRIIFVFNAVSFAWIFFRAENLTIAFSIVLRIIADIIFFSQVHIDLSDFVGMNNLLLFTIIALLLILDRRKVISVYYNKILNRNFQIADLILTDIFVLLLLLFSQTTGKAFIYFQF